MIKGSTDASFKGERSKKLLKASKIATEYQKQYYQEVADRANQGEPVIWTNVGIPQEIMHALDLPIFFNPNWSAIIAAKQMADNYLNVLNEHGYFRDLCRYCSLPFGYFLDNKPEEGPWGGVPKPTALVLDVMDDPIVRIWELMAKKLNIPLFIWDHTMIAEPPKKSFWETVEDLEEYSYTESWRVDYAVKETEGLIGFLENATGRTLSESKLREVMEKSNEQFDYIGKTMDLCAGVPSPISMGDHLPTLISTQFFRGHQFGLEQAKRLYAEVKERVESGLVACDNERVRLMYLLVPNWFTPGFYNAFEEKYGAVFVWMMYLTIIPRQLIRRDLRDPLRAVAARYVHYAELGLPPWWPEMIVHEAKKFKIDGLVYEKIESCRLLSASMLHAIRALEKAGIPTCQIEGDMVDVRDWDDVKVKSQVANFVETLLERK
jgi:benzoyl-CoA reductase subunit B